jgi:fimbrial chaperone protein
MMSLSMNSFINRFWASNFLIMLSAIVFSPSTWAGGFTIMPVRLELSEQRRVGSFTIRNDADSPVTIDVRSVAWTQRDTGDDYTPTRDLIITPMIFSLAPRSSQVVRVGLRRDPHPSHELSYRVFLTEIPSAKETPTPGVAMTLRLSVPLFLKSAVDSKPELHWALHKDDSGGLRLTARNTGTAHVQLANLQLKKGSRVVARQPSPAYLLPGRQQDWPLQLEDGATVDHQSLTLEGYSDAGELRTEIALP